MTWDRGPGNRTVTPELASVIGAIGILTEPRRPGYRVSILGVRVSYGIKRYLVKATDGDGTTAFVDATRVTLVD